MQYGAPGTEFSGYADGLLVGDGIRWDLFKQCQIRLVLSWVDLFGVAGHGATFQDNYKNYWHISTTVISVKNTFERRLGIWPTGFDKDDMMYCNTTFGDYPHYLPGRGFSR